MLQKKFLKINFYLLKSAAKVAATIIFVATIILALTVCSKPVRLDKGKFFVYLQTGHDSS
jgi:hypothetical protein